MRVGRAGVPRLALVMLLVDIVTVSGAMATGASVSVTTGTTILPPQLIEIAAAAGEQGTSTPVTLAWWTNDETMAITGVATDLVCTDVACGADGSPDTIESSAVGLVEPSGQVASLDRRRVVAILEGLPSETPTATQLVLSVAPPAVRPGRYEGSLRFTVVDPTPDEDAATTAGVARPAAGADGASLITSTVVVVVR